MGGKDDKIRAKISGGTAQGVIGAGEVRVEHLVINNYAQPSPAVREKIQAEPSELSGNPYKGLLHFGPDDHALFFGREKAIDKIIKAIDKRSFNAVLGPSGCGKSSLLLAGVAPRLDATGEWAFTYFRVSDSVENDPFLALAQALLPLYKPDLDETDRLLQRRKLGVALSGGEIPFTDVFDAIRGHWPHRRVLLIADQFEELYTSNIDAEIQARFMDFLIEAARVSAAGSPPSFSLAVTLRADFLGLASLHRPFADAIDESVHILGPMKPDELRLAIAEPAGQLGVTFEEGLVETILADVGREPGNLPLLEFALKQMWDQQQDRCISLASYDGVGRVTGALTKHADKVFAGLDSDSKLQARRIFTQLVKPGAGTEDTRRVARRDELDTIWPLVQCLAGPENRLVVTNATADEGETAEVVHEALIKHWGTLRTWVAQDRALLTWLDAFRGALKTWTDYDSREEDLLRGAALGQAEEWKSTRGDTLNDKESAFIDASIEYRDRLQKEENDRQLNELHLADKLRASQTAAIVLIRQKKYIRWSLIALVLLILLFDTSGLYKYQFIKQLENWSYDARLNFTRPNSIDERIVIVDIDENSLAAVGQWPWGHDKLATIVDNLFDFYQADVVAFDIVFAERDQNAALNILDQLASGSLKDVLEYQKALREIRPNLMHAETFANSLVGKNVVLGYYFINNLWQGEGGISGLLPPALTKMDARWQERLPINKAAGYGGNAEILQASARSGGYFDNPFVDADGVFRRVPLVQNYEGYLFASLALATAQAHLGTEGIELAVETDGIKNGGKQYYALETINLKDNRIPVDANGAIFVPYRGLQGSFPYIPAHQVLSRQTNPLALKDKIVLVGTSAAGMLDLRSTPVQNIYAGVEIHANIISGILDGRINHKPAWTVGYEFVLLCVIAVSIVLLCSPASPLIAAVGTLGLSVVVVAGTYFAWVNHLILPVASPLLLLSSSLVVYFLASMFGVIVRQRFEK